MAYESRTRRGSRTPKTLLCKWRRVACCRFSLLPCARAPSLPVSGPAWHIDMDGTLCIFSQDIFLIRHGTDSFPFSSISSHFQSCPMWCSTHLVLSNSKFNKIFKTRSLHFSWINVLKEHQQEISWSSWRGRPNGSPPKQLFVAEKTVTLCYIPRSLAEGVR